MLDDEETILANHHLYMETPYEKPGRLIRKLNLLLLLLIFSTFLDVHCFFHTTKHVKTCRFRGLQLYFMQPLKAIQRSWHICHLASGVGSKGLTTPPWTSSTVVVSLFKIWNPIAFWCIFVYFPLHLHIIYHRKSSIHGKYTKSHGPKVDNTSQPLENILGLQPGEILSFGALTFCCICRFGELLLSKRTFHTVTQQERWLKNITLLKISF